MLDRMKIQKLLVPTLILAVTAATAQHASLAGLKPGEGPLVAPMVVKGPSCAVLIPVGKCQASDGTILHGWEGGQEVAASCASGAGSRPLVRGSF